MVVGEPGSVSLSATALATPLVTPLPVKNTVPKSIQSGNRCRSVVLHHRSVPADTIWAQAMAEMGFGAGIDQDLDRVPLPVFVANRLAAGADGQQPSSTLTSQSDLLGLGPMICNR